MDEAKARARASVPPKTFADIEPELRAIQANHIAQSRAFHAEVAGYYDQVGRHTDAAASRSAVEQFAKADPGLESTGNPVRNFGVNPAGKPIVGGNGHPHEGVSAVAFKDPDFTPPWKPGTPQTPETLAAKRSYIRERLESAREGRYGKRSPDDKKLDLTGIDAEKIPLDSIEFVPSKNGKWLIVSSEGLSHDALFALMPEGKLPPGKMFLASIREIPVGDETFGKGGDRIPQILGRKYGGPRGADLKIIAQDWELKMTGKTNIRESSEAPVESARAAAPAHADDAKLMADLEAKLAAALHAESARGKAPKVATPGATDAEESEEDVIARYAHQFHGPKPAAEAVPETKYKASVRNPTILDATLDRLPLSQIKHPEGVEPIEFEALGDLDQASGIFFSKPGFVPAQAKPSGLTYLKLKDGSFLALSREGLRHPEMLALMDKEVALAGSAIESGWRITRLKGSGKDKSLLGIDDDATLNGSDSMKQQDGLAGLSEVYNFHDANERVKFKVKWKGGPPKEVLAKPEPRVRSDAEKAEAAAARAKLQAEMLLRLQQAGMEIPAISGAPSSVTVPHETLGLKFLKAAEAMNGDPARGIAQTSFKPGLVKVNGEGHSAYLLTGDLPANGAKESHLNRVARRLKGQGVEVFYDPHYTSAGAGLGKYEPANPRTGTQRRIMLGDSDVRNPNGVGIIQIHERLGHLNAELRAIKNRAPALMTEFFDTQGKLGAGVGGADALIGYNNHYRGDEALATRWGARAARKIAGSPSLPRPDLGQLDGKPMTVEKFFERHRDRSVKLEKSTEKYTDEAIAIISAAPESALEQTALDVRTMKVPDGKGGQMPWRSNVPEIPGFRPVLLQPVLTGGASRMILVHIPENLPLREAILSTLKQTLTEARRNTDPNGRFYFGDADIIKEP